MKNTVEHFKSIMLKGGYKKVYNAVGNIKLRPNDQELLLGKEGYRNYVKAVNEIIEELYKDDRLNEYYTSYNKEVDGWMDFNRWLLFN